MCLIGRYSLLIDKDSQYAVELFDDNKRYLVRLPHLVDEIDKMVEKEMTTRQHFAELFKLAFGKNSNDFIKHPDFIIMNYLNDNEVICNNDDVLKFNIKQFLLAYNRWKNTSIKYSEIKELCQPKLR